jgi:hypothetical protein
MKIDTLCIYSEIWHKFSTGGGIAKTAEFNDIYLHHAKSRLDKSLPHTWTKLCKSVIFLDMNRGCGKTMQNLHVNSDSLSLYL